MTDYGALTDEALGSELHRLGADACDEDASGALQEAQDRHLQFPAGTYEIRGPLTVQA